jgi:hypothetical protein
MISSELAEAINSLARSVSLNAARQNSSDSSDEEGEEIDLDENEESDEVQENEEGDGGHQQTFGHIHEAQPPRNQILPISFSSSSVSDVRIPITLTIPSLSFRFNSPVSSTRQRQAFVDEICTSILNCLGSQVWLRTSSCFLHNVSVPVDVKIGMVNIDIDEGHSERMKNEVETKKEVKKENVRKWSVRDEEGLEDEDGVIICDESIPKKRRVEKEEVNTLVNERLDRLEALVGLVRKDTRRNHEWIEKEKLRQGDLEKE